MKILRVAGDKAIVHVGETAKLIDVSGLEFMPDDISPEIEKQIMQRFEAAKPQRPPVTQATARSAVDPEERLRQVRREKLRAAAAEITAARDRGFAETDKYVPAKGLELARFVDLVFLYLTGKLKDDDEVWARNWWTGHQEKLKVKTILEKLEEGFWLRQDLREAEQDKRDEVESVFNDETKSIEDRINEIEKIAIPKALDIPEDAKPEDVRGKLRKLRKA